MNESEDPEDVVLKFISCINSGDSEGLKALQTEDFTFIDMSGNVFTGRDGWEDYFSTYPDYRIHVRKILKSGDSIAIIGKTTGSHIEPKIEVLETVLWVAEITDDLVAKWRIFSDVTEARKMFEQ
jgi:hypothetical protein